MASIVLVHSLDLLVLFLEKVDALQKGASLLRVHLVQSLDLSLGPLFALLVFFSLLAEDLNLLLLLLVLSLEHDDHFIFDAFHRLHNVIII